MHMVHIHCIVYSLTLSHYFFLYTTYFLVSITILFFTLGEPTVQNTQYGPKTRGLQRPWLRIYLSNHLKRRRRKGPLKYMQKDLSNKPFQQNPSTKPFNKTFQQNLSKDLGWDHYSFPDIPLISRYVTHFPICHSFPDNYIFTQKDLKPGRRQHLGWEPLNT